MAGLLQEARDTPRPEGREGLTRHRGGCRDRCAWEPRTQKERDEMQGEKGGPCSWSAGRGSREWPR